jgi:phosphoribosyl-ATP pyrophosphohydrolase
MSSSTASSPSPSQPARNAGEALERLAAVIESRKPASGGDPQTSYVARLLHKGPDAFLKKIGEEATEVVMAAKDADHGGDARRIVGEVADLWFHSMIALAHYGLTPADVIAELERREGTSGIEEKALRKAVHREGEGNG